MSLVARPPEEVERIVQELADADGGRSVSSLLVKWITDRPEVQAKLNGAAK